MNFAWAQRKWLNPSWLRRRLDPRHLLGRRGERAAARFLRKQGLRVLARNYRCPAGEADLIAAEGATLAFIEVKTRSSFEWEPPEEAATRSQWSHLERVAQYFCARHRTDRPCRFDLVTVTWNSQGRADVRHFPDAFQRRLDPVD